jgi:uncharacterized iron-regulated membrane protein
VKIKNTARVVHLWLGMFSGVIISLMCISGALFVFAEEMMHAYNKEYLHVTPGEERLTVDELLMTYKTNFPGEVYYWINTYNKPNRSFNVVSGIPKNDGSKDVRLKLTFINPYTGKIIGEDLNSGHLAYLVAHFHGELLMGEVGLWIIRVATVIFLIELILGLILWWPTSKKGIQKAFKPRHKAIALVIIHDLHRVYGFYGLWLLLISVGTGLIMSFDYIEKPAMAAFGGYPEIVGQEIPQPRKVKNKSFATLQLMYENFEREYPAGYKFALMALWPDSNATVQHVLIDRGHRFLHLYGDNKIFNRYTGKQLHTPEIDKFEKNQDIMESVRNTHMGTIGGWPTKILAVIIGLFGASLPITGFLIWRSRRKRMTSTFFNRKF